MGDSYFDPRAAAMTSMAAGMGMMGDAFGGVQDPAQGEVSDRGRGVRQSREGFVGQGQTGQVGQVGRARSDPSSDLRLLQSIGALGRHPNVLVVCHGRIDAALAAEVTRWSPAPVGACCRRPGVRLFATGNPGAG
jgi:hypothetical protein